jgi:hypothetical protein
MCLADLAMAGALVLAVHARAFGAAGITLNAPR